MRIMNEWETIDFLIKNKCGISRFGDGELKLCLGQSTKTQVWSQKIQGRMRDILKSKQGKCLIGIPRLDRDFVSDQKRDHWAKYNTPQYQALYRQGKLYGSAFITRLDEIPEIDCPEYWDQAKEIWRDRTVVVLQGERKPFTKQADILDTAIVSKILYGPTANAFAEYGRLFHMMLKETSNSDVVILALGATATVLAYDLSLAGRQALDLGHMGMFYARAHGKQTGIKDGF